MKDFVGVLAWLRQLVSGISTREITLLQSQYGHIYAEMQTKGCCCNSDDQAGAWVTQARDLAYDMDNWVSLFVLRIYYGDTVGNPASTSSSFLELFRGCKDMGHKFHELQACFEALEEGRPRSIVPRSKHDPRPTKLHLVNTECLVSLDAAIDEVTRMVTDAGDKGERKVISITGMVGSGKTTLAATVYQRLGEQNGFQRRAFVSVGWKPDLHRILKEMLSQLGDERSGNEEIDQLVSSIRGLLNEKRYLIVLDDLYSSDHWREIVGCFPKNNLGSRVITTTRNDELASECSPGSSNYIHNVHLLSEADSKQLFLKQLETTGHACPPYWDEVSDQIMRRCGGLPLAVVSVAAMLAHNPSRDEWDRLGLNLLSSSHMDGLKQVLNLSYKQLPLPFKSCLLYLSIFPENHQVEVKRVIRLWAAEGLIRIINELSYNSEKEIAKEYVNKLSSRNMVQLLRTKNNHGSGSSWYCRLHPVIHDFSFIILKSKEENFVTLVDAQHQNDQLQNICRLSLRSSNEQNDEALPRNVTTINLSRVRYVTVFGQASATPRLTDLPLFLRVLDLEGCNGLVCLDGLLNLRLLRYLSLRGTDVTELPATIEVLRYLEVLDVGFTKVKELPSSICALRFLEYLSLRGIDVKELPETIGKLLSLRTLDVKSTEARKTVPEAIRHCQQLQKLVTVDLSHQLPSFVESLGQLRSLRVIVVTWYFHQCSDEAYRKALLVYICRWRHLTSLTIHCGLGYSMEFLGSLSDPPKKLQKFKVTAGRFASVPKWISELKHLSFVQITVCKRGTEQLKILGELPKLQRLILGLDFITENPIVIVSGWFRNLERFSVDCPRPWIYFSAGSMQSLTFLELKLCACPVTETSIPSGIGNLQRIKEVSLCYRSLEQRSPNISMIVRAMRKAVTEHPNRIALFINGTSQEYSTEVAEAEAASAAGTGIGINAGNTDDIQRNDEELVNATKGIQSTTEIEEIES